MTYTRKAGHPQFVWAEIVELLRRYFSPTDLEWTAYDRIFRASEPMRWVDVDELAASYVPPVTVLTEEHFVAGEHREILWEYALAQVIQEHCEVV